jgi:hypothetical protein
MGCQGDWNPFLPINSSEQFRLLGNPLLPKLSWRHLKVRLNTLEGELVQLLIELFHKLCAYVEAIEISKSTSNLPKKGLLRPVIQ